MTPRKKSITDLIENSSLGTSAAKKLRSRTTTTERAAILRRAATRGRKPTKRNGEAT